MAFNPFHSLRKHSKVVFAGLVGVAMFSFVLSSGYGGRGDFFTEVGNRIGMGGSNALISVDGTGYDGRQVQHVQVQRLLASRYMEIATELIRNNLLDRAMKGAPKLDQQTKPMVDQIVQARLYAQMIPQFAERYRSMIVEGGPFYRNFLRQARDRAERDKKPDDVVTLDAVEKMIDFDSRLLSRTPGESYFGGKIQDDKDYEETSNFLMWRHQADELGVALNDADVDAAIQLELFGELDAATAALLNKHLQQQMKFTPENLRDALRDELRVRTAQSSLLGLSQRLRRSLPYVNTPEEMWELFKDARTSLNVGAIAVPVEPYLAQVKGQPSEADLKALFEKYKTVVPSPERAEPAFKEPRRIQVEWVAGDADSAFYKEAAHRVAPITLAVAQLGGGLMALGGSDPVGVAAAAAVATPIAFADAPLYQEFDVYRSRVPGWSSTMAVLHDTSILRPENIAMLVGGSVGAGGTGAPAAVSGILALEARATVREIRDRAKVGATAILTAALDPIPLGVDGLLSADTPKPLTLEALRPQLQAKVREEFAKKLLAGDAVVFEREVTRLGKERDAAATVKKYVDEFVKTRGWQRGASTQPRDVFNIIDDPGLAKLKETYAKGHGGQDLLLRDFGGYFFRTEGTYAPVPYPAGFGDDKKYFVWRTEDRSERTPQFAAAKPLVEAAWKKQEARKLAKAEAERIAGLAKGKSERELRDLAAQAGNREFLKLGPMAGRMPVLNPTPGQGRQYTAYQVPSNLIAYPGTALVEDLLKLRKDAVGATTVTSDQPQTHYYAATLLTRDEPLQDEFRTAYANSMTTAAEFDGLLLELSVDGIRKYRNELLKQLREESKVTVNLKRDATQEGQ